MRAVCWAEIGGRRAAGFRTIARPRASAFAFVGNGINLGLHLAIGADGDVEEGVHQNIVGVASTEESEVERKGVFHKSTATVVKALVICLRPDVLDPARLSDSPSVEDLV
jgi:hypothetical protein